MNEKKQPEKKQTATIEAPEVARPHWSIRLLIMAALALAGGALYIAWQNHLLTQQHQRNVQASLELAKKNNTQVKEELNAQKQALYETQQSIAALSQAGGKDTTDWRLQEVRYLVQLADYNLQYERSAQVANALLKTADSRLQNISDPMLSQLRRNIADKIAAVEIMENFDLEGVLNELAALSKQVDKLPSNPALKKPEHAAAKVVENTNTKPWRQMLNKSMATLKDIVIIRHHKEKITPIVTDEERKILLQDIHFLLTRAQWAAIQGQPALYSRSLAQAEKVVEKYFYGRTDTTDTVMSAIERLQAINIKPPSPDMAPLLVDIDGIISQRAKMTG